jgi:hypothetical protein
LGNPYAPPRPDEPGRPAPERPAAGHDAVPGTTGPHGAEPRGARRAPDPEPEPEGARRATRGALTFGLLMLAVVLVSAFRFPWRTAALAVAVVAIVVGVRALVAARRARVRGALVPVLGVGVGLATVIALQTVGTLAAWQVEADYQRCLDGAITLGAQERCETDRVQSIEGWVSGVTGAPVPARP